MQRSDGRGSGSRDGRAGGRAGLHLEQLPLSEHPPIQYDDRQRDGRRRCTLTSSGAGFTEAVYDEKKLYLIGTGNWIAGEYTIKTVVSTTQVTLDRACGTVDSITSGQALFNIYDSPASCTGAGKVELDYSELVLAGEAGVGDCHRR